MRMLGMRSMSSSTLGSTGAGSSFPMFPHMYSAASMKAFRVSSFGRARISSYVLPVRAARNPAMTSEQLAPFRPVSLQQISRAVVLPCWGGPMKKITGGCIGGGL